VKPEVTWAGRLLLALSREPDAADFVTLRPPLENALSLLRSAFPDFLDAIRGKDVLDFGCRQGLQSLAMAEAGAQSVFGLESNTTAVEEARGLASQLNLQQQVEFGNSLDEARGRRFDVVVCQTMEHVPHPAQAVETMKSVLKTDGRIMITFSPPWYAPYGSHMHFFTRVPWVNLFFSEATVMAVRARFRSDGAQRYESVEGGLNKMTLTKFERIVSSAGLRYAFRNYIGVRGLDAATHIPFVREFFTNRVSCVLIS
jgi:SAM-dependent methyltransferase